VKETRSAERGIKGIIEEKYGRRERRSKQAAHLLELDGLRHPFLTGHLPFLLLLGRK